MMHRLLCIGVWEARSVSGAPAYIPCRWATPHTVKHACIYQLFQNPCRSCLSDIQKLLGFCPRNLSLCIDEIEHLCRKV